MAVYNKIIIIQLKIIFLQIYSNFAKFAACEKQDKRYIHSIN